MTTMTDADLLALHERTVDELYRYASRLTGGDATLADELVQETYLGLLRRIRGAPPQRHTHSPTRSLVGRRAVAAAAAVVAIVLMTTDHGPQHITPATVDTVDETNDSVAPTVPSTVTPSVTLDQLAGHRWIVTDTVTNNVAAPWPSAILPFVEFGAGDTLVSGTDGCNDYSASGSLDNGSLRTRPGPSTELLCSNIPDGALHDGDHLVLSQGDGITLVVMSATGDPRLRLVRADALAPPRISMDASPSAQTRF